MTMTLAKPMSRAVLTAKLTASSLESIIYRWNGVKAFTGNGYYWMQNRVTSAGVRALPWYMLDLTACNNYIASTTPGAAPVAAQAYPFVQLQQSTATGDMYFKSVTNLVSNGVSVAPYYSVEQAPNTFNEQLAPFTKSMISSASIQANLWGAKAKATKFMVQVIRISDEDLVPDHIKAQAGTELTSATPKRNDFYQNMIKPWTFNPISTTGGIQARKYKVLKTQTIIIEPNPTTDGDQDGQCVVYKALLKLNKLMNYADSAQFLATDTLTNDNASYALNLGQQNLCQANGKSRIYLVLRATNYGTDAGDTGVDTPSFDLSVRITHTISK